MSGEGRGLGGPDARPGPEPDAAAARRGPTGPARPVRRRRGLLAAGLLLLAAALPACAAPLVATPPGQVERAGPVAFRVTTFATGLDHPWGAAFLPDGTLLVTERPGRLRLVGRDGRVGPPLAGVPAVAARGQGGLLDVAVAPDFAVSRRIHLCLAANAEGGTLTRLVRARLGADGLSDVEQLLDATPAQAAGGNHYGCRLLFDREGMLYLSTGDRYVDKMRAQRLDDLAGKVLRLTPDGRPAPGNPFLGQQGARPEIFTYGHRNPQGLALHPATGAVWEAEFGARGGDEVNLLRPGRNYGWPLVTRGVDYDGSRIGEGASRPDLEEPLHWWVPSVSPSGIGFYAGDAFPAWRGSLFLAALNTPGLVRLSTEGAPGGERVTGEERLLWGRTRLRQVLQGPDGFLYLLTDETQGRILRLEPG
ncbi:PQQ-dependent sugar dehydrogenase [Roseomonas sp. NAR14]|uniref:PQQ-dependent sugar dehydrogenase n=1 Tax=Roseomonas acroporae TaxID=2937791 RepID=A0A9X1Y889_9PROT|nr:PQQ-dependent sugar dehydrogenase [Roseomonas acroporae]MCK8785959.1 PQQ-dependent sugar dehydrogenase [Roseomonas acroporae]